MFVILEKDIFENIEQVDDAFDIRIETIDSLFDSMRRGENIVYATIRDLDKIIENDVFNTRTQQYVTWIKRVFSQIYSCKDTMNTYLSVSTRYTSVRCAQHYFEVPLSYATNLAETKLLTENESDADFFVNIARYVRKKQQLGSLHTICFENDSYHGANAKTKIKQLSKGKRQVLCVVDTDMDYPSGKKGSTYDQVNSAYIYAKKSIPISTLVLPVREKENLFPATVYAEFVDSRYSNLVQVIAKYYPKDIVINEYFDIKDGVKYKKICKRDSKWEGYFKSLVLDCQNEKICCKCKDLDDKYIMGIGDSMCDKVSEVLFIGGDDLINTFFANLPEKARARLKERRQIILNDIPDFVMKHWEKIAETLFDWGCAVSETRFPAVRDW